MNNEHNKLQTLPFCHLRLVCDKHSQVFHISTEHVPGNVVYGSQSKYHVGRIV